ncbi:hypothetical protein GH5_04179 [Leishmania sp. Ghana 2012 LV757]|uniref:hypothetical protein n=1 Tax=Leishmania sp. Ghana 2012 LV757 TaxID=2803181 RepID=UPI001B76CD36|nr:hypothetical protein GH5_04179 [Leishmania sp. Ghana 2012 LV757]
MAFVCFSSASRSSACDCCECGVVVGTESAQRASLLLPCQHVLHMGCVEFIRRRGKVLMGMDSTDLPLDEENGSASVNSAGKTDLVLRGPGNNSWTRYTHGFCVCPACSTAITRIIPLYLRSTNDNVRADPTDSAPTPSQVASEASATAEAEYRRVHRAQKHVLYRLRSLCDQRRRVTELTHACANLHEQRARYLAEVEREERCFPGLTHSGGLLDADSRVGSSSAVASNSVASLAVEHMGVTELELFMAQATPQLLRTQAELRKERHVIERRTKRLNALRMHYHSAKELRALDEAIARREVHTRCNTDDAARHSTSVRPEHLQRAPSHVVKGAPRSQEAGPPSSSSATSGTEGATAASRKRHRGDAAIDVDVEVSPDVVEVLSGEESGADDSGSPADVTVLDVDENTASDADVRDGGNEAVFVSMKDDGTYADESVYEAPYLIPRCFRHATASLPPAAGSAVAPKASTSAVTQHHLRLLPRREARLWQPSLQF